MANSVSVSGSVYGGIVAPDFYTLAYVPASIYDKNVFTIFNDVKTQLQLGNTAYTLVFKDPSATFSPSNNDVSVAFSTVTPVGYEMADKISFAALRTAWQADKMAPGPWKDYQGTPEFQRWFEEWIAGNAGVGNESLYVAGKKNVGNVQMTFAATYAGLLPLQRATSGVIKPVMNDAIYNKSITAITTGTTTAVTVDAVTNLAVGDFITIVGVTGADAALVNGFAGQITGINGLVLTLAVATTGTTFTYTNAKARFINKSNVNDALITAFSLIPQAIKSSADIRIQIPYHIAEAYGYKQGLVTAGGGIDLTMPGVTKFNGKDLIVQTYFEANTISISLQKNNILACDVQPDSADLNIVDFRNTTMDEYIGYKLSMKSIVAIMNPTEHVIFSPLN